MLRKINRRALSLIAAVALLSGLAACTSDGAKKGSAASGTASPTTSAPALPTDLRVHQHVYKKGETFTFVYGSTEATYATVPAHDGKVPRVTDLQKIEEVRATVRFSVVADGAELKKKIELINPRFRELKPADLGGAAAPVAFRPLSDKVAGFPTNISYTYAIGQDAQVALRLNDVFKGHFDPFVYKFIDVFTFPASVASVPKDLEPGEGVITAGVDVPLGGVTYHSAKRVILYDRVDELNGIPQAYFKVQTPGNYVESIGSDSNVLQTFYVPLSGSTAGLVASGELQEMIFGGSGPSITATMRQVSMTMQTATTRTGVEGG